MIEIRDWEALDALDALMQEDEEYFARLSDDDVEFYQEIHPEAPGCISPTITEEWE